MSQLRNMEIAEGFKRVDIYGDGVSFAICRDDVDDDAAGEHAFAFEFTTSGGFLNIAPEGKALVINHDSGEPEWYLTYRTAHNALLNHGSDSCFA